MTPTMSRRRALQGAASFTAAAATALQATSAGAQTHSAGARTMNRHWDKVFPKSSRVDHRKITFGNRYGITVAADLYQPKGAASPKRPALVISGPFGAVKEQVAGLYAQTLAERGFVTLAFDPSFTGESGGVVRNVASPDIFTRTSAPPSMPSACCRGWTAPASAPSASAA